MSCDGSSLTTSRTSRLLVCRLKMTACPGTKGTLCLGPSLRTPATASPGCSCPEDVDASRKLPAELMTKWVRPSHQFHANRSEGAQRVTIRSQATVLEQSEGAQLHRHRCMSSWVMTGTAEGVPALLCDEHHAALACRHPGWTLSPLDVDDVGQIASWPCRDGPPPVECNLPDCSLPICSAGLG